MISPRRHGASALSSTYKTAAAASRLCRPTGPGPALSTTRSGDGRRQASSDWSASQYLRFAHERTRPARDLAAQLPALLLPSPARVVDLGCGPGNSTAVLAERFPGAHITAVDSSPDMLARARAALGGGGGTVVDFALADLRAWDPQPAGAVDLVFGNAVFQWLRRRERIPALARLLRRALRPGGRGVLALQVPDNHGEPTHAAMREVALREGEAWSAHFRGAMRPGGDHPGRPDLDPIESPAEYYDALAPLCGRVDMWHTIYQHPLGSPADVVEWVRGSGLQPFLAALPDPGVRDSYLRAYADRIAELYPRRADGRVLLRYPRLFVVATTR